jgi:hypothetical protein
VVSIQGLYGIVVRTGSVFDFSLFDTSHQLGIKVFCVVGKVVLHPPPDGHQLTVGMADDFGNLSVVPGQRLVQAISDLHFHGTTSIIVKPAGFKRVTLS